MMQKTFMTVAAAAAVMALAGCQAPGGYQQNAYGQQPAYGAPPPPQQAGYDQSGVQQAPPGSVFTGRVETIEPITTNKESSGILGTVIGAAAGGLLGHQVGGGRGNTAATIGGAVIGGVAGNQVQRRTSDQSDTAYRVRVRLEDGRIATVTQRDVGALRVGDRARVANDMATPY